MDVISFIESNFPDLVSARDVKAIAVASNQKTIEKKDSTLKGPILIENALGQAAAGALEYVLDLAGRGDTPQAIYVRNRANIFVQDGLDLSDPRLQAMIDQFVAAGLPAEIATAVKSLGIWQESSWEGINGRGAVLSEQEITEAIVAITRRDLYRRQAERYNALVAAMDEGTVNTDEEAAAFFGGA